MASDPWAGQAQREWFIGLGDNDKITLRLDKPDPTAEQVIKTSFPKPARYSKKLEAWNMPLLWETCLAARTLANRFGVKLNIGPKLTEWANAEKVRRASVPDVLTTEYVEVERISAQAPRLYEAMTNRKFQTVGAAFMARNRYALLADDPGLGKTLQAIGAVLEADITGPILVVAPKSAVYDTWRNELPVWVPNDKVFVIGPHLKSEQRKGLVSQIARANEDSGILERVWVLTMANYTRAKAQTDEYGHYVYDPATGKPLIKHVREAVPELHEIDWATIIIDESHRYLPTTTSNAKKHSAQRQGLATLRVKPDGLRIAMSGTPFRGKREYAWGTLNWLRPDLYRSSWKWLENHFDVYNDGYGMRIGVMKDERAFYKELEALMVRRTKAEVAQDLPPKMYGGTPLDPNDPSSPVAVWLSMGDEQARVYWQMAKEALAELEGGDVNANGALAIITRLKQFACSTAYMADDDTVIPSLPSNKFDWLVEFLAERGIDGGDIEKGTPKIVVASQFRKTLEAFAKGLNDLGIETVMYTGKTSDKQRTETKAQWQSEDGPRVMLLTLTAGGVSLTLDAHCDELVLIDETHSPDDSTQVEDRIHRLSRIHQVTIWKLKSLGTIEENIARTVQERGRDIRAVLDGQRGVDTAIRVIGG